MEAAGATALDLEESRITPGDHVIVPRNNSNTRARGRQALVIENQLSVSGPSRVTTMSKALGAGFYSSVWGPLPFAFGPVPPEGAEIAVAVPSTIK